MGVLSRVVEIRRIECVLAFRAEGAVQQWYYSRRGIDLLAGPKYPNGHTREPRLRSAETPRRFRTVEGYGF
jgi:hypothetical protein